MSGYNFSKFIIPKYPSKLWDKISVKLYKNGKTCQVTKKAFKAPMPESKKVIIPEFSFAPITSKDLIGAGAPWKSTKPPTTKVSKEAIMEGKLSQLVKFHHDRKHAYPWDTCVACKAIRAFIQWEFHQTKKSMVQVGQLTKEFFEGDKIVSNETPQVGDVYLDVNEKEKGLNVITAKDLANDLFKATKENKGFKLEGLDDGPN